MFRLASVCALMIGGLGCSSPSKIRPAASDPPIATSQAIVATKPPAKAKANAGPFAWEGTPLLSGSDRDKRMEAECPWLTSAIKRAKSKPELQGDALIPHLKAAALEHGKEGDKCLGLLTDGIRSFREDVIRAEAKATLRILARSIREAEPSCLASTPAVPSSLDAFASSALYDSSPAEWSVPAWQCLAWRRDEPQRYRYAVHLDDTKTEFVAVAERGDGTEVLFVRAPVRTPDEPTILTRRK